MLGPKSKLATNLVLKASVPSMSRHRIDPIKHTEVEQQADESPPEIKQQCLIPIDTHIYEDKLCKVVTRNVDQVNDVIIYDRSISKNLKDVFMRTHQLILHCGYTNGC